MSREKPYLFLDEHGDLNVRVPAARTDTSGTTWANGETPGRTLPIGDFFVAKPSDSVQAINSQLARVEPAPHARRLRHRRDHHGQAADAVVLGSGTRRSPR